MRRILSAGLVTAILLTGQVATAPAQAAAAGGTVQGTYLTDGGEPLAGARVLIFTTGNNYRGEAATDAGGHWAVPEVAAGDVKVQFQQRGLVQWAYRAADFASATVFTVADGETVTVDDRRLPTGTFAGVVTDEFSDDAWRATAVRTDGGGTVWSDWFQTPDYSFEVPPGEWRLHFQRISATVKQWYPGTATSIGAQVFTIAAGQTITVNETLVQTADVEGLLKSASGRPRLSTDVSLWQDGERIGTSNTYEEGYFLFRGVLPGDYLMSYSTGSPGEDAFLPGTLDPAEAKVFTVVAGQDQDLDETTVAYGTLTGRLVATNGAPVAGFTVRADHAGGRKLSRDTTTANDGTWRMEGVFPGESYRVSFQDPGKTRTQYAYSTTDVTRAEVFPVPIGGTITVDDTWREGSLLAVRAVDAVTGAPADGFCATLKPGGLRGCTPGPELTIAVPTPGDYAVTVEPLQSSNYLPSETPVPVTVTAGADTSVSVPLALGGRAGVLVLDRATGLPFRGACVTLVEPGHGAPRESGPCSNSNGKITIPAKPAGVYQMFVYESSRSDHGRQWVGAEGGTGDQREAVRIRIKAGKKVSTPTVLMDRGEEITGVVRDPSGAPMADVRVSLFARDLDDQTERWQRTDVNGRYKLYSAGPYSWPVLFTPETGGVPRQWSGGTGNRFQATPVNVQVGQGATYDITLLPGSALQGTVTGPDGWRLTAVNAITGDQLGRATATTPGSGAYRMPLIGGQPVKVGWTSPTGAGWWENAADLDTATKVPVPRTSPATLDLTID